MLLSPSNLSIVRPQQVRLAPIIQDDSDTYSNLLGAPPEPMTPEYKSYVGTYRSYRLRECPLARTTYYYFSQDGNDSNDGLSQASPKRTLAEAQSLIASLSGGTNHNIAILFRRGDVWREATGVLVNGDRRHITIGAYGSGEDPVLDRFVNTATGWTLESGDTYEITGVTADVAGVYTTSNAVPVSGGTVDSILEFGDSLAAVQAGKLGSSSVGIWWHDRTNDILYLNLGGTNPATTTVRFVEDNSDSGIELSSHGCRVDHITAIGWGMEGDGGSATQATGIKLSPTGTNVCVASNCCSYYSGSHAMHTNTSGTGGITFFDNCKAGLCSYNGSSGETIFNTFASTGTGQETTFWRCDARYGSLPDHRWYSANMIRGRAIYAHNGTGTTAWLLAWDCEHTADEFGVSDEAWFTNGVVHGGVFSAARSWVFNETHVPLSTAIHDDVRLQFCTNTTMFRANGTYTRNNIDSSIKAFTNGRQRGICVQNNFDLDVSAAGNAHHGLVNASNTHDGQFYFNKFILRNSACTGSNESRWLDFDGGSNSASLVCENNTVAWLHDDTLQGQRRIFSNVDVDNNAYLNSWDGSAVDYGNDTNAVDMTESEAAMGYVPVSGDNLYQAGKTVTPTIEVDRHWKLRDTSNQSIGSIAP